MTRIAYFRIALAGAAWFALVAGIGLPLFLSALPAPFRPSSALDAANQFNASLVFFGLPASIVGFSLANRIANSYESTRVFGLGVVLVVVTNLLTGMGISAFGSHFISMRSFLENAAFGALAFLLIDLLIFKGAPFLLGGLSALAFRAGIQRIGWAEDEF